MGDEMISWALKYASLGWHVFPVKPDKKPYIEGWPDKASKDAIQINAWWSKWPDASIGVACGPKSGIWVLDVDLPDGPCSLMALVDSQPFPATMKQQTGGGGEQYIWRWNKDKPVRNSTNNPSKNIDVRGEGGYVILPPSNHPSGNKYAWVLKAHVTDAPDWLLDLVYVEEKPQPTATSSANNTRYGEAALRNGLDRLSKADKGTRNHTLNNVALGLGHLIAGEELDRTYVESSLHDMALKIGLEEKESQKTIESGINKGMKDPKKVTDDDKKYYFDFDEVSKVSKVSTVSESKQEVSTDPILVSTSKQEVSTVSTDEPENQHSSPYNLAANIKEWIINSSGSFTVDQIDREFCLKTRSEKTNRAKCLSIYKDQNLIKKDKTIKGKWHVIDSKIDWIDLEAVEEGSFPIELPFGMSEKVSIPPKSVIVIAGSSNAGKTSLILNILNLNLKQPYGKVYLMSEMGGAEYKDRIKRFEDPAVWQNHIQAAAKSYDFDSVVKHHNPDGMTCIDFLEEVDGEYFKIPSSIRDIYDALGDGVAIIAIQKKKESEYARGGEATSEKARLYITVDFLCSLEHSIVCALKLVKVKRSLQENMIGRELHFKIEGGSQLTALTEWIPAGQANRTKAILEYQGNACQHEDAVYKFITLEGKEVGLRESDYQAWKKAYAGHDLDSELQRVSKLSHAAAWMRKKDWFLQLGIHLDKWSGIKRYSS